MSPDARKSKNQIPPYFSVYYGLLWATLSNSLGNVSVRQMSSVATEEMSSVATEEMSSVAAEEMSSVADVRQIGLS